MMEERERVTMTLDTSKSKAHEYLLVGTLKRVEMR